MTFTPSPGCRVGLLFGKRRSDIHRSKNYLSPEVMYLELPYLQLTETSDLCIWGPPASDTKGIMSCVSQASFLEAGVDHGG